MATLKHIASKNSDYTAIEAYLVYQHDAFTGKQLLDEQGKPKLRESYLLDTLECGDFSFATACLLANRKYGKNTQQGKHRQTIRFFPFLAQVTRLYGEPHSPHTSSSVRAYLPEYFPSSVLPLFCSTLRLLERRVISFLT